MPGAAPDSLSLFPGSCCRLDRCHRSSPAPSPPPPPERATLRTERPWYELVTGWAAAAVADKHSAARPTSNTETDDGDGDDIRGQLCRSRTPDLLDESGRSDDDDGDDDDRFGIARRSSLSSGRERRRPREDHSKRGGRDNDSCCGSSSSGGSGSSGVVARTS